MNELNAHHNVILIINHISVWVFNCGKEICSQHRTFVSFGMIKKNREEEEEEQEQEEEDQDDDDE